MLGELADRIRARVSGLRVIVAAAGIAFVPMSTIAGPAILSTAQPGFQDPLSSTSRPAAARSDAQIGEDAVNAASQTDIAGSTSNSGFTIIGDQGTSGLEEPAVDDLTQQVRDEILGRSQNPSGADENVDIDGAAAADSGGSAAEIVRALVNTVPGQENPGGGDPGQQQTGNQSLLASVIDGSVTDLVITLLNPEQAADGMVKFSIAGFGDFALLHLQENNSFFLVDLDGGSAIKIVRGDESATAGNALPSTPGKNAAGPVGQKSNALQRIIAFLEDNVLPFVQSPITLAAFGLFSVIWIIWRLSANA